MNLLIGIGLVILGTLIGAFGALYLKKGSAEFAFSPKKLIKNWPLLLGIFLYLISTVPFILGLKYGDLSVLYPFVATSYIWVTILSVIHLKEKVNIWKILGIAAIILGVVFIGFGS